MTPAQIAELRRLAKVATAAPWRADGCELIGDSTILATLCWHTGRDTENEADKALIVALRNGVRGILAERDALVRVAEALECAANALDDIAERTWDKRHPEECKSACADASEMAAGARDEARRAHAALAAIQEKPDAAE